MNPSQAITSSRGEYLQFPAFMFICVYSNRSRAELTCVLDYHLSYFFDYNTVRRDAKASGNKGLLGRRAFAADGTLGAYGEKMVNVEVQYGSLNTSAGGSGHLHNLSLCIEGFNRCDTSSSRRMMICLKGNVIQGKGSLLGRSLVWKE